MGDFLKFVNCQPVTELEAEAEADALDIWQGYVGHDHSALWHTYSYMYYCCRKSTLVQFRRGKMVTFWSFENPRYVNGLNMDRTKFLNLIDTIRNRQGYKPLNRTKAALPTARWSVNGPIVRYDVRKPDETVNTNLFMMERALVELSSRKNVPDCDFFLNVKDYPVLARNRTRPHTQAYGSDVPLPAP
ncbi:tyrosine kinase [Singapore grouper iridovirus]|uniref:Tyrosine kinase n=1 Tax=Singapore grouper iridovirus TaxID=262968 RepID=Q5YFI4_9VIRU|nr:tyrosine kinase [Singapore grouper iridovirus]AAS18096.1 tyrosine kinase [Singapore grouper iridovirus]WAU86790.1 tyrosine kinase [Singapore grouper iridovirus]